LPAAASSAAGICDGACSRTVGVVDGNAAAVLSTSMAEADDARRADAAAEVGGTAAGADDAEPSQAGGGAFGSGSGFGFGFGFGFGLGLAVALALAAVPTADPKRFAAITAFPALRKESLRCLSFIAFT